ncbi:MAG: hypothetical protein EXR86_11555 [Gammaproteobacteria bacterium]|nr:hypothetical protein [Gammaproteobacteria bacterium]
MPEPKGGQVDRSDPITAELLARDRPTWITLMLVVLAGVALGLRLYHLDHESLFMDELRQVSYYPASIGRIIQLAATQQQPPLDYLLGHFVSLLSYSDFSVRLPAALFGSGSVVLITVLLLPATNPIVAFSTGLIAALLPFNLYFSQYARPYAIAVFFMLLTVLFLDRVIRERGRLFLNLFLLFVSALLFLFSRSYPPPVVVGVLMTILGFQLFSRRGANGATRSRVLFAMAALGAVVATYIPVMRIIMATGQRYAPRSTLSLIEIITNGWGRFAWRPLWEAYLTQTEPLGFLLLPTLAMSAWFMLSSRQPRNFALWIVTLLLPLTAISDAYVFPAMSDYPYRTPYPIYILPYCLILAAAGAYLLWHRARLVRILLVAWALCCLVLSSQAAVDFRHTRKHEDWKHLIHFLEKTAGPEQLLIFDAIAPPGAWEPAFYGFPRYYHGASSMVPIREILQVAKNLRQMSLEPVAILFVYRNIYLTSASPYPIMPAIGGDEGRLDSVSADPELVTQSFTSFLTVRLKSPSGQCAADTLRLFGLIEARLKSSSSTIDLQLSAGALAFALGHVELAERYLTHAVELAPVGHEKTNTANAAAGIRNGQ